MRVPSGVAYSEAIRRAMVEVMGNLYEPYRVSAISAYYAVLKKSLETAAPPGVDEPCVAVVSRGEGDSAYFEDSRIAKACNHHRYRPLDRHPSSSSSEKDRASPSC